MTRRTHSTVRKNGNGRVKELNKEAFKVVKENANKIAQSLLKSTEEGHVLSTRLLVELAEGDVDVEEASMKQPLRSLALRLAQEAPFEFETPDEAAKTATESTVTVGK